MAALTKASRDYHNYIQQKKLELIKKGRIHADNLQFIDPANVVVPNAPADVVVPNAPADLVVDDNIDNPDNYSCHTCQRRLTKNAKGKLSNGASLFYNQHNQKCFVCGPCKKSHDFSLQEHELSMQLGKTLLTLE